ncbi:MAG: ribonuclease III [Actinobacteria bacterium]|nr:ribonuclease III [Actinomycetota bacterium]
METRGLPAFLRAVPARLFQRPPRRGSTGAGQRPPGGLTLRQLIEQLPVNLRDRALTHSSWVEERTQSYERLEFLGDSVLGLAIASTLCRRYPDSEEGELAKLKAFVVSRASCAQVAEQIDLAKLIIEKAPASEDKRREIAASQTILGNVLEALIGAVFLTHGFEQARLAVVDAFDPQIRYAVSGHVDHKTTLQELVASRGSHLEYRLVEEAGPPHARVFTSEVRVDGVSRGRGNGTTIKMSEQAAAREALRYLTRNVGDS